MRKFKLGDLVYFDAIPHKNKRIWPEYNIIYDELSNSGLCEISKVYDDDFLLYTKEKEYLSENEYVYNVNAYEYDNSMDISDLHCHVIYEDWLKLYREYKPGDKVIVKKPKSNEHNVFYWYDLMDQFDSMECEIHKKYEYEINRDMNNYKQYGSYILKNSDGDIIKDSGALIIFFAKWLHKVNDDESKLYKPDSLGLGFITNPDNWDGGLGLV